MTIDYKTKGTCSSRMRIEVEDGVVKSLQVTGGCNGNLQGLSKLVAGMKVPRPAGPGPQTEHLKNAIALYLAERPPEGGLFLCPYRKILCSQHICLNVHSW